LEKTILYRFVGARSRRGQKATGGSEPKNESLFISTNEQTKIMIKNPVLRLDFLFLPIYG
jgi:hypothetical protein